MAVPKTPSGNQGTCNHFKPRRSNKITGIAPIKRNRKISLLVHFKTVFTGKILLMYIIDC